MPVPPVNQAALDREKYDLENYHKPGLLGRSMGIMHSGPDVSHAAKSGQPTMTDPKRTLPASIPVVASAETGGEGTGTGAGGTSDVSATTVGSNSLLDKAPDARTADAKPQTADQASNQPLPSNRDADIKKFREQQAKKQAKLNKKKKKDSGDTNATGSQPQSTQGQSQLNQSNGSQNAQTTPGVSNATAPPANATPSSTPPVHQ